MSAPRIAIAPVSEPGLEDAVASGGGVIAEAEEADGLVWVSPRDPEGLKDVLGRSPATWVQLPFAGIESFVRAGAIDPARTWTCTKGAYGPACAEHALALMLAGARRLANHARAKKWEEPGFGSPERRLAGATVLIFGTGGIGRALVPMLQPLGVRMLGISRSGGPVEGIERTATTDALRDLVGEADYVVIAAALTDETYRCFDASIFEAMKPSAWLINVARGGLVDTDALIAAVEGGAIAGAALDVTDPEPLPPDHPLWELDQVLITPHVANTWDMAVPELRAMVERNVAHFARNEPLEGIVDPALGY
ncbi:MAG TPA: D-isomer specific 2-hydroxyacid dehydrogenase family protein [Actinomycetota bacterium]|nr:D-isomer specific 2-hydroxyacid dehydrogenase family protein [Actinomycetota bacterium]